MLPKYHILIGLIASILILVMFPSIGIFAALLIFSSSFLIDLDHYLYHTLHEKNLSLLNAYNWFIEKNKYLLKLKKEQRDKYKNTILIFHGIESWILLLLLASFNKLFIWVLLGVIIHMPLDYIELAITKRPFYIKFSQIYVYFDNLHKKPLPNH